jgi:hypothetical protein
MSSKRHVRVRPSEGGAKPANVTTRVYANDPAFAALRIAMASEQSWGEQFGKTLMRVTTHATGWDQPREETGQAAWQSLEELRERLEGHAYWIAQDLASAQWLWFLRRIGWLFEGRGVEYPASGQTMEEIAESISDLSATHQQAPNAALPFPYRVDQKVARSLWKLNVVSTLLWGVAVRLLWVGKGASIRALEGELPEPIASPDIKAANAAWDKRVALYGTGFLAPAGLYAHSLGQHPGSAQLHDVILLWARSDEGFWHLPFYPGELRTVTAALPVEIQWPTPLLDLLLLFAGYTWSQVIGAAADLGSLRSTGCRTISRAKALSEIRLAIDVMSAKRFGGVLPGSVSFGNPEQVLARLASQEVSIWPASLGTAIRSIDDQDVIEDMYAASARLQAALERPLLNEQQSKAWATAFELSIQDAIDHSDWKPRAELLALRGHEIKDGKGTVITDIDAIGENAGRLLLVSCKCRPFSDRLNRGEHSVIREAARLVDDWVSDWRSRASRIRALTKVGDLELGQFAELIGPVVTPAPIWSATLSTRAEIIPGLYAAMGATEFGRWINPKSASRS